MTCTEVRELAAELVLGTLDGSRRAAVVAHLASCVACRAEVAELTRVTDALLLSAPEAEPPSGFESRVLDAVRPRRRPRITRVALAAAAVVVLLVAGLVALRPSAPAYAAGPMRDQTRAVVGHAAVDRTYVHVTVDGWGDGRDYVVEVIRRDGTHVTIAPIRLTGGRGAAGGPLTVPYRDVRAVWVTDPEHTEWCAFRLGG